MNSSLFAGQAVELENSLIMLSMLPNVQSHRLLYPHRIPEMNSSLFAGQAVSWIWSELREALQRLP